MPTNKIDPFEKRIRSRAEQNFRNDLDSLIIFLEKNRVLEKFKYSINKAGNPDDKRKVSLLDLVRNVRDYAIDAEETRDDTITKYAEKEADNLVEKLDSIKYLFNQQ